MADLPNPFSFEAGIPTSEIDDDHRFVLDEEAFFEAIEPVPLFLRPVIELLAGYST